MTAKLLGDAFAYFPYQRHKKGDQDAWPSSIEMLRQFLRSLDDLELRSLYTEAAKSIENCSFRGPSHVKLWFFSHPSYDLFTTFLQDNELCRAFAVYLESIARCRTATNHISRRRLKNALASKASEIKMLCARYAELICKYEDGMFSYYQIRSKTGIALITTPEVLEDALPGLLRDAEQKAFEAEIIRVNRKFPQYGQGREFAKIFGFPEVARTIPFSKESIVHFRDEVIPHIELSDFIFDIPTTWRPINTLEEFLRRMLMKGRWQKFATGELPSFVKIRGANKVTCMPNTEFFDEIAVRLCGAEQSCAIRLRKVEHGMLPVGLKIHCVTKDPPGIDFLSYGGFRVHNAGTCFNLPPVGSVKAAVEILQTIEDRAGVSFLNNPDYQIQVCSPGEFSVRNAALLGIGFYLGSDPIRRYSRTDFDSPTHTAGRLLIYGAGVCDLTFEWWGKDPNGTLQIGSLDKKLHNRTDVLSATSVRDIENVNLIATLLTHAQNHGYWSALGFQFIADMETMLKQHELTGLLEAEWVLRHQYARPPSTGQQELFWGALEELMLYAFEEVTRIKRAVEASDYEAANRGILFEMQRLLQWYRTEIELQSPRKENR